MTPLIVVLCGLFVSSFFLPVADKTDDWTPLLSGFVEMDLFYTNKLLLAMGGILSIAILVVSIYFINAKTIGRSFSVYYTSLFALLFIFSNPCGVYFSAIYPAAILLTWVQYCLIVKQRFTAFFLLACASLFYAPILWLVPVVLIITLIGTPDFFRVFLKSFTGLLIPYLYILSFRYILFNDMDVFVQHYFKEIISMEFPIYSLGFTTMFLVLCFVIILLHAVIDILSKLNRQSILTGYILKQELITIVLGALLFFVFWGDQSLPLGALLATPGSLILSHYFLQNKKRNQARVELVLLMSAAVIARAAYFI